MKKLLGTIAFILFISTIAVGQSDFISLKEALKNSSDVEQIKFSPTDKSRTLNKFFRKKDKFNNLYSVYIESGFEPKKLEKLVKQLNEVVFIEFFWECDTLGNDITLLSQLENIDNLSLINFENLSKENKANISTLDIKSLTINQTTTPISWETVELPKGLNNLTVKDNSTLDYDGLVARLSSLKQLSSLTLSLKNFTGLPKSLISLQSLTEIGVLKSDEIGFPEDDFYEESYWVSVFKGSTAQIIELRFKGVSPLSNNEKQQLLSSLPNSSFIGNPNASNQNSGIRGKKRKKPITTKQLNLNLFTSQSEVAPLIVVADVKRTVSRVYADVANGIEHNSGTVIHVPANAFVDENGNVVEGKVDISYREMKTPTEIMLAGIPMAYDSGGVVNQFQSAGNFEILAAQNGKPLNLAKGKEITIDFVSADSNSNYNFYKYNSNKKNWDYSGTANKPVDRKKRYKNETLTWSNGGYKIDTTKIDFSFDITPFEDRFYSEDHIYLLDSNRVGRWSSYNRGFSGRGLYYDDTLNSARGGTKVGGKNRLLKLSIKKKKRVKRDSLYQVAFKVIQRKQSKRDYMFFPELRAFGRKWFYTIDETKNRYFRKEFTRRKRYYDIKFEYVKGDDICLIHLKNEKGLTTIEVDVTEGRKGIGAKYKRRAFYSRYKRYLKLLKKRERIFNKRIESNRIKEIISIYGFPSSQSNQAVSRSLSISGLGVYNCDQIRRLSAPVARLKSLKIKSDSIEFVPITVYVVDKSINGVLTYSLGRNVSLNIANTNAIIAIDKNGGVFYTNAINSNDIINRVLDMKKAPIDEIKTASQFNALLGL